MPKCAPKLKIGSITPSCFRGDCTLAQIQLSFTVTGCSKRLSSGTVVTLQYTRCKDKKTSNLIGSTTIDANGNWAFTATNLVVNNPLLGSMNIFAQAVDSAGTTILAYDCDCIDIKCVKPKYFKPCKRSLKIKCC